MRAQCPTIFRWVRASPNYLVANNFTGVPESTIAKMKQT
jgi:oxalate decarboxylase